MDESTLFSRFSNFVLEGARLILVASTYSLGNIPIICLARLCKIIIWISKSILDRIWLLFKSQNWVNAMLIGMYMN